MSVEDQQSQRPFRRKLQGLGKRVGSLGGGVVRLPGRLRRQKDAAPIAEVAAEQSVSMSGRWVAQLAQGEAVWKRRTVVHADGAVLQYLLSSTCYPCCRDESRFDFFSSLRAFNPFPAPQTASALSCFPARFCQQASIYPAQTCQELMAVGTRLWGPGAAQSLLRVKIYEFAIFMDGHQV